MKARAKLEYLGWGQVPTHVEGPAAAYWQRWEHESVGWPWGWVELPSHMPPRVVYEAVRHLPGMEHERRAMALAARQAEQNAGAA